MADTKSTAVTNCDSQYPEKLNSPWLTKGTLYTGLGVVAIATGDANGQVYRMCRIPSGALITSMKLFSDAIAGATSAAVGIYAAQGTSGQVGAVVSGSLFASGINLTVAQTEPYDVLFNNLAIKNIEKRVWELAALSADPMTSYDICIVGTTLSSSSGNVALMIEYTI